MFQSGAQFVILVALVGLLLMREARQAPLSGIDETFADFLAINARRTEEVAPVTLVGVDESSLEGRPWPWSPVDFALFFQAAEIFKPAVLATDEVLAWDVKSLPPETARKLPQYQKILREHVLRAPSVLLAARLGFPEDPSTPPPIQETPVLRHGVGDLNSIPEFTAIEAQAHEDFRLSSVTGFTNLPRATRFTRTVPLVFRYHGQVVPSFVLQAILMWEKLTPDDVVVEPGVAVTLAGRVPIPVDRAGRMRVDFGVRKHRCGFDEMVLASDQIEHQRPPIVPRDWLTDNLVLLARTDSAAQTLNFAPTRKGSAGELFAAAIGTIQKRSFIKRIPEWFDFAVIIILALVARACRRWRKLMTLVLMLVAAAAYVMLAITLFGQSLVWLPAVLPAGLAIFIVLFRLATPGIESKWDLPPKEYRH
jgi:CHASE2 domain-containing sensor protein